MTSLRRTSLGRGLQLVAGTSGSCLRRFVVLPLFARSADSLDVTRIAANTAGGHGVRARNLIFVAGKNLAQPDLVRRIQRRAKAVVGRKDDVAPVGSLAAASEVCTGQRLAGGRSHGFSGERGRGGPRGGANQRGNDQCTFHIFNSRTQKSLLTLG